MNKKIQELKELIEFEYGDCNCDCDKKCSYCKIIDQLKEYKEAARSEAQEVNELQAENKKLREALDNAHDDFTKQGLHKQASRVLLALNITTTR